MPPAPCNARGTCTDAPPPPMKLESDASLSMFIDLPEHLYAEEMRMASKFGEWDSSAHIQETGFVLDAIFDPQLEMAMREEPSWAVHSKVEIAKFTTGHDDDALLQVVHASSDSETAEFPEDVPPASVVSTPELKGTVPTPGSSPDILQGLDFQEVIMGATGMPASDLFGAIPPPAALFHEEVPLNSHGLDMSPLPGHPAPMRTGPNTLKARANSKGTYRDGAARKLHNWMERNRRIRLRGDFDALRVSVPSLVDKPNSATLEILRGARDEILELERVEKELLAAKSVLLSRNQALRDFLSQALAQQHLNQQMQ